MTSTTNPKFAILTESLAQAAYTAFTEIENQSRIDILRAESETREARAERDRVARDLHAATLEAQGWKQEAADAKAALAQEKLTLAHQAESQLETIAQLRREVTQWKDQSRNWQEHFLRVEQERCAQSSRIDELVKLQYTHPINAALFTPKQKYANATHINSAPSSITTKGATIPSPTQPPSYKSAAPPSTSDTGSRSNTSSPLPAKSKQTHQRAALKRQRNMPLANPPKEAPQTSTAVQHQNLSSSKRKTKGNNSSASSSQRQDPQTPAASRTTLIRRVQAVIHVKREGSDDDSADEVAINTAKDEASDEDEMVGVNPRRSSRRSRKIIKDNDEDVEPNHLAADGNPVWESRHLRHRNASINYREEDDDEDDDDELMMGAEENHEEVYGTQRVESLDTRRSKQQQQPYPTSVVPPPPKKKRKLAAR